MKHRINKEKIVWAWFLLTLLSLCIINEQFLAYINLNIYTKIATVAVIQLCGFSLLMEIATHRKIKKQPKKGAS